MVLHGPLFRWPAVLALKGLISSGIQQEQKTVNADGTVSYSLAVVDLRQEAQRKSADVHRMIYDLHKKIRFLKEIASVLSSLIDIMRSLSYSTSENLLPTC